MAVEWKKERACKGGELLKQKLSIGQTRSRIVVYTTLRNLDCTSVSVYDKIVYEYICWVTHTLYKLSFSRNFVHSLRKAEAENHFDSYTVVSI